MISQVKDSQATFLSTMLIDKLQRQLNYSLKEKLMIMLKRPVLTKIPFSIIHLIRRSIILLGGIVGFLIGTIVLGTIDMMLSVSVGFILLLTGIILTNKLINKWLYSPPCVVTELNTFVVSQRTFNQTEIDTSKKRDIVEENVRKIHRNYKRTLLNSFKSGIKNDFELKNSRKFLISLAKEYNEGAQTAKKIDDVQAWAYSTMDRIHKGTRLFFWNNNANGENKIIFSDSSGQKKAVTLLKSTDVIVDELTLLIFANRYSIVLNPLLQEIYGQSSQFKDLFSSYTKENGKHKSIHSEKYAEALRVLLSKVLGMQEILKSTTRQIHRLQQARMDFLTEIQGNDLHELEQIVDQLFPCETFDRAMSQVSNLPKILAEIAKSLRAIDFDSVPLGLTKDLQNIVDFYLGLEKLRFFTTWFDDIAYYTALVGGNSLETGATENKSIASNEVLSATNIFKNYQTLSSTVYALRGVDLSVKKGEFVIITGTSGSGKTTLLNILAGLDRPDRGSVYVDGINITELNDTNLTKLRRDKMGFIFQYYNLLSVLDSGENISFPADIAGNRSNIKKRVKVNLEAVELEKFQNQYPNKLSGGQMQRVTIARSLINSPSVLFADEPTGDLDSVTGEQIMQFIKDSNKRGTTVILVTHDPSILKYADRILSMKDGVIVDSEKN